MAQTREQPASHVRPMPERLAGAPISWGACEVPGWGRMPDAETVLAEMVDLGLRGTELGPPGFLPAEPDALSARLRRHGLSFVGAFTPLVLHDPDLEATARHARRAIDLQRASDAAAGHPTGTVRGAGTGRRSRGNRPARPG
jgi:inosose dehydratase